MPNPNFSVKLTLDEANDTRLALQERLDRLMGMPVAEMSEEDKASAGRTQGILNRDFGGKR